MEKNSVYGNLSNLRGESMPYCYFLSRQDLVAFMNESWNILRHHTARVGRVQFGASR
jgi:hypothetical protein